MSSQSKTQPKRRLSGLALGIFATIAWMLVAGFCVQSRHDVPSLAAFKGAQANVVACAAPDLRGVNLCLDAKYDGMVAAWRSDTGVAVVMPPMLAWVFALLQSLCAQTGLFRRRQGA